MIINAPGPFSRGGPPLVKAATGEDVTAEELGGADVHTRLSGVADYFADDDEQALQLARTGVSPLPTTKRPPGATAAQAVQRPRTVVSTLHTTKRLPGDMTTSEPPRYDSEELYGVVNID